MATAVSPTDAVDSTSKAKADADMVGNLQKELNQTYVTHREELYWLRLELDTTRREKEAAEDRMAELYRDLQEMQQADATVRALPGATMNEAYVVQMQDQVQKYERMMRVMNNQLTLVRNSSDTVVKSLKEEISDIMDEKVKMELNLMNQLSDMEKETQELMASLHVQGQSANAANTANAVMSPQNKDDADENGDAARLQMEVNHLRQENNELTKSLAKQHKESLEKARQEKEALTRQVEKLQGDMLMTRPPDQAVLALHQMQQDRHETLDTLERASLLWDRADESIQKLESVMMELKPKDEEVVDDDESEQLLSTLETASLVHGQIKVSLMLIELKLRNNLACIKNDQLQLGSITPINPVVNQRISEIQAQAMAAIGQVEAVLKTQVGQLEQQSILETQHVTETLESKVTDLERMEALQQQLQRDISILNAEGPGDGAEHVVSTKALEQLQGEVLQVIERVREKNESIGRLTATVDEHKVRERSLMEELKRLMKDQSEREFVERQSRVDTEMRRQDEDDDENASYCDDSTTYVERSVIEDYRPPQDEASIHSA